MFQHNSERFTNGELTTQETMHEIRKSLDLVIQCAEKLAGRNQSLTHDLNNVIDRLIEARMWTGRSLEKYIDSCLMQMNTDFSQDDDALAKERIREADTLRKAQEVIRVQSRKLVKNTEKE